MGALVLCTFILWLLWLYSHDGKEQGSVSRAAWIVVVWAAIYGSRPVTAWLSGIGLDPSLQQSRDEGNPTEAFINFSLMLAGFIVLARRGVRVAVVIRENRWLFVFYLFWFLSIGWSDYPFITFKRLFKELGSVIMVLVILTDREPIAAMKVVFTRVAYLLIPLSIILIRWYPNLGRIFAGYDLSQYMWVGVTTHKNALGALAFVVAVFLLWILLDSRKEKSKKGVWKITFASRVLVLVMCWYLLLSIDSATSLVCALVGSGLLFLFRFPSVSRSPGRLEAIGLAGLVLLGVLDSALNLKEVFVESLGRHMSLTTRTDIWPILINSQENILVGAGFDTFWIGERFKLLSDKIGSGLIQAHNGYLETYLNGGLIGVGLLLILLLSSYWRLRKRLLHRAPDSIIRLILLLLAIVYNNSEASFNKIGFLWLVSLYAIMEYRVAPTRRVVYDGRASSATSVGRPETSTEAPALTPS